MGAPATTARRIAPGRTPSARRLYPVGLKTTFDFSTPRRRSAQAARSLSELLDDLAVAELAGEQEAQRLRTIAMDVPRSLPGGFGQTQRGFAQAGALQQQGWVLLSAELCKAVLSEQNSASSATISAER